MPFGSKIKGKYFDTKIRFYYYKIIYCNTEKQK